MKRHSFLHALGVLILAAALVAVPGVSHAAPPPKPAPGNKAACGQAPKRHARCLAQIRTGPVKAMPKVKNKGTAVDPPGLSPAHIRLAYKLPAGVSGQTVAVVTAYDNPNAESDLAAYRQQFGLPACTTANGCFKKLNQRGVQGSYPAGNTGWGLETSLDLDSVSAACPGCKLVLVEADSPAVTDLAVAVDTAAAQNPVAISNSYGLDEFAGMDTFAPHYDHPNTTILASSGDFGFRPASYPAVLNSVVAAGGTRLVPASNTRGWTETAWSGSGSGCSAYIAKPSWQQDPYCHMRTTSDISAVADPETGLAVYDTYGYGGWVVVGGTSLSSPLLAGMIGRSGFRSPTAASIYANNPLLFDVVGGSNGRPGYDCGGDYLCTGLAGYDAPTGWGTPNGTGVFGPPHILDDPVTFS